MRRLAIGTRTFSRCYLHRVRETAFFASVWFANTLSEVLCKEKGPDVAVLFIV